MNKYILLVGAGITVTLLSVIWYLNNANEKLTTSLANEKTKSSQLESQAEHNKQLEDYMTALSEELKEGLKTAADNSRTEQDTFREHDLNEIASKKPELLRRVMQRGTDRKFKEFEEATQ